MAAQEDVRNALEQLQSQLAFQEDTINALNEAVARQQADILVLQRQLELLRERQQEQAAALEGLHPPDAERPPHY